MQVDTFIDLETIPTQDETVKQSIRDNIKPPAQYTKADSIEAWRQEKGPAAAEEAILKTSFNGGRGQIFCLGLAFGDEAPIIFKRENIKLESEALMLVEFNKFLTEKCNEVKSNPYFIGHYISGFDLRFLFHRMVIHRIKPGFTLPYNDAPWAGSYFDTMTAWAGAKDNVSLKDLCSYLGLECSKGGMDGSKVWPAVQAGLYQDVWDYNAGDIEDLRHIYKRLTFKE